MNASIRNVGGLHATSKKRATRADEAITDTLRVMLRRGHLVTVAEIARRAGVSRSTVYRRDDVMAEVERARNTQSPTAPPRTAATPDSVVVINRALQAENKKLKKDLAAAQRRIGDLLAQQRLHAQVTPLPIIKKKA